MNKKKKEFNRYTSLLIVMALVFTAIVSRLAVLQIVKADEYKEKANTKAITEISEYAPRGKILDSSGAELAKSVQSYNLTFGETEDSLKYFFDTMDTLFKILDENKVVQKDELELKINPFRFEFKAEDEDTKKALEIKFKRDKGMNDKVEKKLFPDNKDKLNDEQIEAVNEKLLEITPEETFNYLVEQYGVSPEGIFKKVINLYNSSPEEALTKLASKYKATADEELKTLLSRYLEESKKAEKDELFKKLYDKCNVEATKLQPEKQLELERRYILVKDALKMQSFSGYKPVTIASDINSEAAYILYQKLNDLPGVDISMQPMRFYPYGQLASGVIGYISKIGSNHEKYEAKGYDVNTDYIGIQGIEGVFEDRLKGTKGGKVVKLNRQGRVIEELGSRESSQGQTIKLTINKDVQYAAETALDKVMLDLQKQGRKKDVDTSNATRGAAVAIDVNTGAVLALVSRPGFNPNDFSDPKGLSTEAFNKYFNPDYAAYGKNRGLSSALIERLFPVNSKTGKRADNFDFVPKPLFNYATFSLTPPGSTFKPMTAIAGLESGVITPNTVVDDHAVFNDGKGFTTTFYDNGSGAGRVALTRALAVSSNPYFMRVGQLLRETHGDNILAQYAWKFGLGVDPNSNTKPSTGIEIAENFGQVFNTASNTERVAQGFLWSIMESLKQGTGLNSHQDFISIDLYDDAADNDNIKKQKDDIKKKIKDAIKEGKLPEKDLRAQISSLISTDSKYKGKTLTSSYMNFIMQKIWQVAIYDGHTQVITQGNMYNASIGQGMSSFTPLQLANYVATIVNGGNRYSLHLVDKILDSDGKVIQETKPQIIENTGIKPSTVEAVKAGMQAVNSGEDGTARYVFSGFPIATAGKTGSATSSSVQDEIGRTSNGVYVGFAPYENPRIAVAVMVFDGGHGGYIAPVARAMYEAYFKEELDALGYTPTFKVVAEPIE
ncbi:penicillin-binding transpeptidase domain-containing protein [Clostridium swellfunianum]|uniref:penicillin-binding transpeptidase domain-containing protein n=1 Tax=Clostridium swellfunianum TaxID=1367462 RepID=UPI00202E2165|nr:penicillin-binding transpeptidase domain-containing protein [Clostridium swellfunianum]MCM0648960.1 penicillin-binding transpeptidase domain-containing protein [Clostridium swellfunianum]